MEGFQAYTKNVDRRTLVEMNKVGARWRRKKLIFAIDCIEEQFNTVVQAQRQYEYAPSPSQLHAIDI